MVRRPLVVLVPGAGLGVLVGPVAGVLPGAGGPATGTGELGPGVRALPGESQVADHSAGELGLGGRVSRVLTVSSPLRLTVPCSFPRLPHGEATYGSGGSNCHGELALYLVAAPAVEIRSSLHFSATQLRTVVASYYRGSAAFAFVGGNAAELLGRPRLLRSSMVLGAGVLVKVATLIGSWSTLAAVLFVAGAAALEVQMAPTGQLRRGL